MKAGGRPDAYLSCDRRFLEEVEDQFLPGRTISENPMVLITPRGNPAGITDLDDLTRSGARIGLAHPDKSALGSLTRQLLVQRELIDPVIDSGNWVQQAPQGDFLVNAMRAGSLDAAIVYTSNAARSREELEVIPIDTGTLLATQPWAIAKTSDHRHTLGRLHDALVDEDSAERFKALGFNWVADDSDEASGADEP
jgi:molybdate transport system substrate-binding protein